MFLVVGCFLDAIPAIIIVGTILQPLAQAVHMDPVHFAMIGIVSLAFGLVTPPYGLCLMISCSVAGIRMRDALKDTLHHAGADAAGAGAGDRLAGASRCSCRGCSRPARCSGRSCLMQRIGFIGASGMMGHGMAKNLRAKGHPLALTVHRNRERIDADLLTAFSFFWSPRRPRWRAAPLVFLCVTGSPQVEAAVAGPDGLLAGAGKRPGHRRLLHQRADRQRACGSLCAAQSVIFIDAPLARTPAEAEAGKLNVMVGAKTEDLARIEPLLKCFRREHLPCRRAGAGHIIKLLNNFIAQAVATPCRGLRVGQRPAVDLKKLVALVSAGLVNSGLFQIMSKTLDGELDGMKFELNNARKDVRYYTHMAESPGRPHRRWARRCTSRCAGVCAGLGEKLVPSLVEAQEKLASAKIVPR